MSTAPLASTTVSELVKFVVVFSMNSQPFRTAGFNTEATFGMLPWNVQLVRHAVPAPSKTWLPLLPSNRQSIPP